MLPKLYTPKDVQEYFKISVAGVEKLVSTGELQVFYVVPGEWRCTAEDIKRCVRNLQCRPPEKAAEHRLERTDRENGNDDQGKETRPREYPE